MLSFKSFLTEARMSPLYHATSAIDAKSIINDNLLRGSSYNELIGDKALSLTRNFKFAEMWLHETMSKPGVIFELDQQKLTHNYKLVPFNYFARYNGSARLKSNKSGFVFDNQYEESIQGRIKNLDRYLKKIMVSKESLGIMLQIPGNYSVILDHPLLYDYTNKVFVNRKRGA